MKPWKTAVFILTIAGAGPFIWPDTSRTWPRFVASAQGAETLAAADRVMTDKGMVEGKTSQDKKIRMFLGIPFAAPPVGNLRWKPPQPAASWAGVKKATEFGHRAMQGRIWDDMIFRDPGPSEDCLYLNVWTPALDGKKKLPVMVWIYGGGLFAGGSSEPRQDGENLARKGVVVVSFNYRLGIFGFYTHPELTAESEHHASGNYGLLDQVAALEWVKNNIAAFGGDPRNVTIFGESAGSFSVSALMASPLSKGLFHKAIGESGAFFGEERDSRPRVKAEEDGVKFAESLGAHSLKAMRAKSSWELLKANFNPGAPHFGSCVDGYFLPTGVEAIFKKSKQSHIPLLAGWNADEGGYGWFMHEEKPTPEGFAKRVREEYGDKADTCLKLYSAKNDDEVKRAAGDLAGDRFIAYSTWKWLEAQVATGHAPVYRYEFDQAMPAAGPGKASPGAYHSSEIEFVFGALRSKHVPWRPEDWKVSELMGSYWSNFAKTGNPNGPGLPKWPAYSPGTGHQVMHLTAEPKVEADKHRSRYKFLESLDTKKKREKPGQK